MKSSTLAEVNSRVQTHHGSLKKYQCFSPVGWQNDKMHRFESISDPGRNKSHQHASGDEFCMEIIGSQFGGVKLFQYWGFLFGENFEAQTWVEHAIFALRERRLTTWPLRHDTSSETIKTLLRQPQRFLNRFFEYCWRQHNCLNSPIDEIPQYY